MALRVARRNAGPLKQKAGRETGEVWVAQGVVQQQAQPHWSGRLAFFMAAVGSAVGLGNVWKFPYMAGTGGGSAFVLMYLGFVLLIGVPILMAELMLGRKGGQDPVGGLTSLGRQFAHRPQWGWIAGAGVLAALLILSFYSVVAGWALAYVPKLALGQFTGTDATASGSAFGALLADPGLLILWHTLFMGLTVVIVAGGVTRGIEVAVTWLMPGLFLLLLVLLAYAAVAGDFAAGAAYLFKLEPQAITAEVAIAAAGQAFFSLSIGLGVMLAYGSYLPPGISIPRTSVAIALADTAVAVIAGLAIFPIVFANGLNPAEGPGLVFVTLPVAFGNMPAGAWIGAAFFVLLAVAAITSSVSLLEPAVAVFTRRTRLSRLAVAGGTGVLAWGLGLLTVFSFNIWADVKPLGGDRTIFDWIDFVTASIMLPVGGVLLALFAGWKLPRDVARSELAFRSALLFDLWRFLVRWVAPLAIAYVAVDRVF